MFSLELTAERIAENQSTFREANERIEATADKVDLIGPAPFLCECPDPSCFEIVRLTLEEYEDVRQDPRLFFTAPGHETISVGAGAAVVEARTARYVLVEKVGLAGEIAAERYDDLTGNGTART